jgi:hypothetical protein
MLRASFGNAFNVGGSTPFQLGNALESSRELECLADAVYYEARGETPSGQAAVAQVVLNRVRSPKFPKTVCGVVFQRAAGVCQFSFACDGSMRRARDIGAWARARKVAARALAGDSSSAVGSATHFHTINVSPGWGPRMMRIAQVGMHIFYRFGRHGGSGFAPSRLPSVDDIAPSEIASLTADGKPPVVYAASAIGRLEPASTTAGMGGPVGPVSEPASAPIATAAKTPSQATDKPAAAKAIPASSDRQPLDGLKTTVGAASGAAS